MIKTILRIPMQLLCPRSRNGEASAEALLAFRPTILQARAFHISRGGRGGAGVVVT
jgi:hypothetical protein